MIAAAGIDLGGTKCETQLFDANWTLVDRRRVATPDSYDVLVETLVEQVTWALEQAGQQIPIGVGAAGLVDAQGNAFTANLPAMGKPLPRDVAEVARHPITYVNDCRALALSEAAFGVGQGYATVMSLILGTGVGGGVVYDGTLRAGPSHWGGEFGHIAASAAIIAAHGLPIFQCGCGRKGCAEAYISGPALSRLAKEITGQSLSTHEIGEGKNAPGPARDVWAVWLDLTSDLLLSLMQTTDPDVVVLGGGLSQIANVDTDISAALAAKQIEGFAIPKVVRAAGGDASGARGAALAAVQEAGHV